jgi:hypothetical protein
MSIEAGADPNAAAAGGVTPLHRAVRNRCSSETDVRLPSRRSCAPVPNLASQTTAARPRPTSLTGQPGAVARLRSGQGRTTNHYRTARAQHRVSHDLDPHAFRSNSYVLPGYQEAALLRQICRSVPPHGPRHCLACSGRNRQGTTSRRSPATLCHCPLPAAGHAISADLYPWLLLGAESACRADLAHLHARGRLAAAR